MPTRLKAVIDNNEGPTRHYQLVFFFNFVLLKLHTVFYKSTVSHKFMFSYLSFDSTKTKEVVV